jgi:hypothetical protein
MPRVEFEPTTPIFERAKAVHALDRAATVIGHFVITVSIMASESITLHLFLIVSCLHVFIVCNFIRI